MKRSWIGLGILVGVLLISLLTARVMDRGQSPIAADLEQAAELTQEGRWEQARAVATRAQAQWVSRRSATAWVADHTPMEEIDSLFAQVEVLANAGEQTDFAAACAQLAKKVTAISQAHSLSWWGFF